MALQNRSLNLFQFDQPSVVSVISAKKAYSTGLKNFHIFLTLSTRSAHLRALLNVVYNLAPKRHIRALFSSQSPSNKTINNLLQSGGDLKRICDISSQFFRVFLAELTICLQGGLNMANFYTDIGEFWRICFKTPEDIYR